MRCSNVIGRVRLSVFSVWALTTESLDLETLFLGKQVENI